MVITNEILHAFVHCQFKAYKKNKGETGIISEYEKLYVQLRQRQKLNFCNTLTENKNLITWDSTSKVIPPKGLALNLKFANEKINLIIDGAEFTGRKSIVPLLIIPFEKVTKIDKFYMCLQAEYMKSSEKEMTLVFCPV